VARSSSKKLTSETLEIMRLALQPKPFARPSFIFIMQLARTPFTKDAAFFELAAEATDNSNLGFEFAQSRDTGDAGLLGYLGLNSPTVKDALKNLSRYRHVMSDALRSTLTNWKTVEPSGGGAADWRQPGAANTWSLARQTLSAVCVK
jgi:hypothetical protein